jgi:hypothetical protein
MPGIRYGITHVPACLPAAWHEQHLAPLTGPVPEKLLRRAAAVRLARTCTAASFQRLGDLLGIPPAIAGSTVRLVCTRLESAGREAEFEAAIGALAAMLDTAAARTDYGRRRNALRGWVISPGHWQQLTAGLPPGRDSRTDESERQRTLASAWVWTRVTGGERLFAPAVMTDPSALRTQRFGGRDRLDYIRQHWPDLTAATPGRYGDLRQRLDNYADELAASIDGNPSRIAL